MPVKIELFSRYQLRTKETDSSLLLLPVIEIKPTDSPNYPFISSIEISVLGQQSELVDKIKSAYKSVSFNADKLLKLTSPQRLRQNDCIWNQPLPKGINLTLRVTVEYFDSDDIGKTILSVKKTATADCSIWTFAVENARLRNVEASEEISDRDMINETPILNHSSSVISPKSDITYPGWFAIDFGTSNSTVTLYDPKVIVTPHTLPSEQEEKLSEKLAFWLTECPVDEIPGIGRDVWQGEWQKLFSHLSKNLENFNPANLQLLRGEQLLDAIKEIEICLSKRLGWFRRAASKRLNQIYHEVFRVPALEWQSLLPVELDKDRRLNEIPSELEVINLEPSLPTQDPAKVKVMLGEQAYQHRLDAIKQGENIDGRFLHSPKRYFGQERSFDISLDGKEDTIPVNQLLQAAYAELIELTQKYRLRYPGKCSDGDFYRAVLTYPTIASPFIRREIETLVKKLGIEDVQMAYDEAVSAAIFFLWQEFGGDLNLGIESFKSRCRHDGSKWWQNVLVLDIGGGTTDLALIRLTLEEIDPFEPTEDRGDGGRYYKLTPKLLGSSGHLQLGGELISLRIFLLLKVAIADCLLSAVSDDILPKDVLKVQPEELNERFLDNGKYRRGSLLACVDKEIREGDTYKEALNDAEKVLPTRWKNRSSRSQTFYDLWEHAENAKLVLGQKRYLVDAPEPIFVLDGQQISELLFQNDIQLPTEVVDKIGVTLTGEQFNKAASPVIQEAIGIASGLIENAFKSKFNSEINFGEIDEEKAKKEQVDWLILSGKTCNLELVERELYRVFSKSDHFVWNEERVTFEPEYTKLATSAGACFAEKLRQLSFSPKESKDLLRKGANQLYINVKNLFYFLPCSFVREV
ncbi:MAG: molecular chaperone, partial [Cyanobacteria bacterium P01_D01_bin.50]